MIINDEKPPQQQAATLAPSASPESLTNADDLARQAPISDETDSPSGSDYDDYDDEHVEAEKTQPLNDQEDAEKNTERPPPPPSKATVVGSDEVSSNYAFINKREFRKLQKSIAQIQEQQNTQQKLIEQIQSQLDVCIKAAQVKSNSGNFSSKFNEISNTKANGATANSSTTHNSKSNPSSSSKKHFIYPAKTPGIKYQVSSLSSAHGIKHNIFLVFLMVHGKIA